jgi:CheY-like chemotaxis protein
MVDPILFAWNPGPFADQIVALGGCVATDRDALRQYRRRPRMREAPLVVLAEWAPTTGRLSDLEGLKLIVDLFDSERQVPPVTLCSFLPRAALTALGDERGEAARLMFPFLRLPAAIGVLREAASQAHAPSRLVQAWLRDHVLSPHPFSMWEHNFRREAARGLDGLHCGIEELAAKIRVRRSLLSRAFDDLGAFERLLDDGLRAVRAADAQGAGAIQAQIQEHLRRVQRRASPAAGPGPAPHAIIVVEDDDEQRAQIVQGLRPYFTEVVSFGAGAPALEALRQSSRTGQRFDAVISDWDLREGGETGGIMQPLQGPDVLVRAAEFCTGPLVGLTSLPGDVVASILNSASDDVRARLSWFPKRDPRDLASENFQGLAHHVVSKIRDAADLRDESPAALGFKHWREHGLGDLYATVRMWKAETQQGFFSHCAGRAKEIVAAYQDGAQTEDVSGPAFSLAFNVPSGDERGAARYTVERLQDVLCARLVVLALYGRQTRHSRSYGKVLGVLFPRMLEAARGRALRRGTLAEETYPPSFKSMMAVLGLATRGDMLDLGKLRLMPHERDWLENEGLSLDLPPVLHVDEQEQILTLADDAEEILRCLRDRFPDDVLGFELPAPGAAPDEDSDILETGERALAQLEAAASALRQASRESVTADAIWPARAFLAREIEGLTDEGVFEALYRKVPDWRKRLTRVVQLLC